MAVLLLEHGYYRSVTGNVVFLTVQKLCGSSHLSDWPAPVPPADDDIYRLMHRIKDRADTLGMPQAGSPTALSLAARLRWIAEYLVA